jgi:gamma-glutamyltranspeptidase/glutathione hydrolase
MTTTPAVSTSAPHEWAVPRQALYGTTHAVSSGRYLATAAAFAILEAGGNAVDAGCCAGMALAVLHADEVNFAGVAPIMIRMADGTAVSIDGPSPWKKHSRGIRSDPRRRPSPRGGAGC